MRSRNVLKQYLLRPAVLSLAGCFAFLGMLAFLVPAHSEVAAPSRAMAMAAVLPLPAPPAAAHQKCDTCHGKIAKQLSTGKHSKLTCKTCHGKLAKHAANPAAVIPPKPDTAKLCVRCHAAGAAHARGTPQIDPAKHAHGVPCKTCHDPHHPSMGKK